MALSSSAMNSQLHPLIFANLKQEFNPETSKGKNYPPLSDDMLNRLARAIADAVSKVVVQQIQSTAEVVPGQAVTTSGTPTNHTGSTTSPGKVT